MTENANVAAQQTPPTPEGSPKPASLGKQLMATGFFAAMILLPIVADNFISRRPDIRLFGSFSWGWLLLPIVILLTVAIPIAISRYWQFKEDIEQIESYLKIAERELLKFLGDNWDQAGRQAKVKERGEWAAMASPTIFPTIFHRLKEEDLSSLAKDPAKWSPLAQPSIVQAYNEGYRSVAHEAFELNKTDMANRGKAMGKASMTAVLLRELYQGSAGRARSKIAAELAAGGDAPFVAPGIRELIGFEGGTLKEEAPYDWVKLTLAVRHGQYPKELLLIDKGETIWGWRVIWKLTQQRPPADWKEPAPVKPQSMWRLWVEWLFTIQ